MPTVARALAVAAQLAQLNLTGGGLGVPGLVPISARSSRHRDAQNLAPPAGEKLQFSRHGCDRRRGVVSQHGSEEAPQVSAGLLPSSPVMPSVRRTSIYRGRPNLLLEDSLRHSLGWQDHRKAGLSIVVVRLGWLDRAKVKERFPLTEQGWADAWQALSGLDAAAAAAIARKLEQVESGRRAAAALAALDAESLRCLRRMTYNGGAGGAPLTKGQAYDVRFLSDRIMICYLGRLLLSSRCRTGMSRPWRSVTRAPTSRRPVSWSC
jgi:hypothetical protein